MALTPEQLAQLTFGHDQAAGDVDLLLADADLNRWLAEDGPVIAAARLWLVLFEQGLDREQLLGFVAQMAVRLAGSTGPGPA